MVARLCIVLSVAILGGCSSANKTGTCVPGASAQCACPGGLLGAQTCTAAGTFAECLCAAPPADAGGSGGAGGAASASAPGQCIPGASVQCACFDGRLGSQTCTLAGTFAACVCAAPPFDAGSLGGAGGTATSTGGSGGRASAPADAGTDVGATGGGGQAGASGVGGASSVGGVVFGGSRAGGSVGTGGSPGTAGSGGTGATTKQRNCRDSAGYNQACTTFCGDGNIDPGEDCDDGNQLSGDGCSNDCKREIGFVCLTSTDAQTCKSGTGQCLQLPIIYRDFQPQNVAGGHPDFYFLGTKNGNKVITWCVPNSAGPARSQDSTARCWDIVKADLLNGKPQFNDARAEGSKCDCQFSDWSRNGNGGHVLGYLDTESPLWDPSLTPPNFKTPMAGWTSIGGPIWHGAVDIVSTKANFDQWFNDDPSVNRAFPDVLEMQQVAGSIYQYSSPTQITPPTLSGGFFPLDRLNPIQATLCNLFPYWHTWPTCTGDQYLFPPRITAANCPVGAVLSGGCWVAGLTGIRHDFYFTTEARTTFVYDGTAGLTLQFYGDDDVFVFINGKLALDLGGVHEPLPGKVVVRGESPLATQATIVEGGCLDALGNIVQTCGIGSATAPAASSPADYRTRTMDLGLKTGSVYELAIFSANRHPNISDYQLTLSGNVTRRSVCQALGAGVGF